MAIFDRDQSLNVYEAHCPAWHHAKLIVQKDQELTDKFILIYEIKVKRAAVVDEYGESAQQVVQDQSAEDFAGGNFFKLVPNQHGNYHDIS